MMNAVFETTTDAGRLAAVRSRDRRADGRFVYSVATTGVYCRPSCAARPALAHNIAFHDDPTSAERSGFRACKRCMPASQSRDERNAAMVATACATIAASEEPPSLDDLADAAGLSRFYFHKIFRAVAGMTPKAYLDAHRARIVRDGLHAGTSVTSAYHDAGFSSSRFYERANAVLGMAPSTFRNGAPGETIRYALISSSMGPTLVGTTDKGICAVLFGDDRAALEADLSARFPLATIVDGDASLRDLADRVIAHIDGAAERIALPLDLHGTAFQLRVWDALQRVRNGTTTSYRDLAAAIGMPAAVRAVASACAKNPAAVVVPCHRVVRSDGTPGNYRWGTARKRALLEREAKR